MQPKHHVILYTFLSLSLVIVVFLSFDYGTQAQQATRTLEEGYAQRVLETQEHLQAIGIKLGKAPIARAPRTCMELLAGASKQADAVVTGLSALPLSHVAMGETVKFCNQLSEYTMGLALSMAAGGALSSVQEEQLRSMESQCSLLLGQFVTAQGDMLKQSLQMASQSNAFYQEAQLAARPLEQVADGDNGMDYPSMIYDGAFSDARNFGKPKALGEEYIDAGQALRIAQDFVGKERVQSAEQGTETAGELACFGVILTLKEGAKLNVEVTKQGGRVLWMVPEHAQFAAALTLEECMQKANAFLLSRGYGEMEANHYQVYDGLAVMNFASVQEGVLLYPDLIKVQVRMDTGEVVGLESHNYLMNHVKRGKLTPKLTKAQALDKVSSRLTEKEARLCVISYRDVERLCYEVSGRYGEHEYRVYVDADSGAEVQVLMMIDASDGQMSA
ncbi:MAG: germination protein YpeB [Clostridia bacterium]